MIFVPLSKIGTPSMVLVPGAKNEEKNPALDMVRRSMGKALIDTKNQPKRQHWSKEHMRKDTDPKRYDKKND